MFWRGAPPKNFEKKVKTPLDLLKEIHVCGGLCALNYRLFRFREQIWTAGKIKEMKEKNKPGRVLAHDRIRYAYK